MWKATANKTRSLFIFPHGFMNQAHQMEAFLQVIDWVYTKCQANSE